MRFSLLPQTGSILRNLIISLRKFRPLTLIIRSLSSHQPIEIKGLDNYYHSSSKVSCCRKCRSEMHSSSSSSSFLFYSWQCFLDEDEQRKMIIRCERRRLDRRRIKESDSSLVLFWQCCLKEMLLSSRCIRIISPNVCREKKSIM